MDIKAVAKSFKGKFFLINNNHPAKITSSIKAEIRLLIYGQSIQRYPCVFCSGAHAATQCQQMTSIEERKKIIGNKKIFQLFQPETSKQRISVTFIPSKLWSSSSLQSLFQSCKVQQSFNVANDSQQEPLSNDSLKFKCV